MTVLERDKNGAFLIWMILLNVFQKSGSG